MTAAVVNLGHQEGVTAVKMLEYVLIPVETDLEEETGEVMSVSLTEKTKRRC